MKNVKRDISQKEKPLVDQIYKLTMGQNKKNTE